MSPFKKKRKVDGKVRASSEYYTKVKLKSTDKSPTFICLHTRNLEEAKRREKKIKATKKADLLEKIISPNLRDSINTKEMLDSFLNDMKIKGRNKLYITNTKGMIETLIKECNWIKISSITPLSFTKWRESHLELSPKSLNKYLITINMLLNWMHKNDLIEKNKLSSIDRVEERGKRRRERRIVSTDEIKRIINIHPVRGIFYELAIITGLRKGELGNITWSDFDFDRCIVKARSSITKNKKDNEQLLSKEIANRILNLKPVDAKPTDKIFKKPTCETFKRDLERAGIPYIDERGKYFDFHSFRYCLNMYLDIIGASFQTRYKIMRHNDHRQTSSTYIVKEDIETKSAINKVAALIHGNKAHQSTPNFVSDCSNLSFPVSSQEIINPEKTSNNEANCCELSPIVLKSLKRENGGRNRTRICDLYDVNVAIYAQNIKKLTFNLPF